MAINTNNICMYCEKRCNIANDIKKNAIFLSILFIGSIPQIFSGYSNYLLVLLIPFMIGKIEFKLSKSIMLCLLFGLSYTMPLYQHDESPTISMAVFYMLYPWLFYMIPTYLNKQFRNSNTIFIVLTVEVISLASWSIWVNIQDAIDTGQFVNLTRSISDRIEGIKSATNHNMMLSLCIGGIGMIFAQPQQKYQKYLKIFQITFGLLALFAAFHLLNRTSLFLAAAAMVVSLLVGGISVKRVIFLVTVFIILSIVFIVMIDDSELYKSILGGFESREANTKYGMSSAGNRDVRWLAALESIPQHPFGVSALMLNGQPTFAHNTWLDCGVQAGWVAFIILVIITIQIIRSCLKFLNLKRVDNYQKIYCMILITLLFLQFMVEPVIQGIYQLFLMMFFIWAILNEKNFNTIRTTQIK